MKDGRFEVGDRVRCVRGFSMYGIRLIEGQEYTVTTVQSNGGSVDVDNKNGGYGGWMPDLFELVEPKTPQYRDVDMQPGTVLDTNADGVAVTTELVGDDGWWDIDAGRVVEFDALDVLGAYGLEVRVQVRRKP